MEAEKRGRKILGRGGLAAVGNAGESYPRKEESMRGKSLGNLLARGGYPASPGL